MVVSYAPLRPCHVFERFPPCCVRPIGRTNSQNLRIVIFHGILVRQGMHRLIPSSTKSTYFIYIRGVVIVKFLNSAKFGQKMTLKSALFEKRSP